MSKKVLIVSESDDEHVWVIKNRLTQRSLAWVWLQTDNFTEHKKSWSISRHYDSTDSSWLNDSVGSVWYRKRFVSLPQLHDPVTAFVQQEQDGLLNAIFCCIGTVVGLVRLRDLQLHDPKSIS